MNLTLLNLIFTFGLLLGMLFCLEIGRRIGLGRLTVDTEGAPLRLSLRTLRLCGEILLSLCNR